MYEVSVSGMFSAAHRLRGYKGRCEKLHGHNWRVEVSVEAPSLNKDGMVVDFTILKGHLKRALAKLDHTFLNELAHFRRSNPTSENIAQYIYQELLCALKGRAGRLKEVVVWETEAARACFGI